MGDFAVITKEIAEDLIAAGFELREFKPGKYISVWYFDDLEEVRQAVESILKGEA